MSGATMQLAVHAPQHTTTEGQMATDLIKSLNLFDAKREELLALQLCCYPMLGRLQVAIALLAPQHSDLHSQHKTLVANRAELASPQGDLHYVIYNFELAEVGEHNYTHLLLHPLSDVNLRPNAVDTHITGIRLNVGAA